MNLDEVTNLIIIFAGSMYTIWGLSKIRKFVFHNRLYYKCEVDGEDETYINSYDLNRDEILPIVLIRNEEQNYQIRLNKNYIKKIYPDKYIKVSLKEFLIIKRGI